MTRQEFLARLRAGARGLPPAATDEIIGDYEAHFDDGAAAGRDEASVAQALGDPDRLARELKAQASLNRWEAERNPSAAANAVFAVLGLGAIDILVLLPIVLWIIGALFAMAIVAIVAFAIGVATMVAGPFVIHGGPIAALILLGLGLMFCGACIGALTAVGSIGCTHALVWYGRLHLRLLKPALDAQGAAA